MNGGYVMIDFQKIDILSENIKIDGVFSETEKAFSSGKTVVCVNAKYNGMESSPITVFLCKTNGKFIATSSILQLEIFEDDTIKVNNLTTTGEKTK